MATTIRIPLDAAVQAAGQSDVYTLQQPVFGLAIGGGIPLGSFAMVTGWQQRQLLQGDQRDEQLRVMMPDDAVRVNYPQGVAVMMHVPYALPDLYTQSLNFPALQNAFVQQPAAEIIAFGEGEELQQIQVRRLPGLGGALPMSDQAICATIANVDNDTMMRTYGANVIPTGAKTCTVSLVKTVTGTRQRLAEDYEVEIYWLSAGMFWTHNPSDDFRAASTGGTGVANAAHDAEVFQLDGTVRAVYARYLSGGTPGELGVYFSFGW